LAKATQKSCPNDGKSDHPASEEGCEMHFLLREAVKEILGTLEASYFVDISLPTLSVTRLVDLLTFGQLFEL